MQRVEIQLQERPPLQPFMLQAIPRCRQQPEAGRASWTWCGTHSLLRARLQSTPSGERTPATERAQLLVRRWQGVHQVPISSPALRHKRRTPRSR